MSTPHDDLAWFLDNFVGRVPHVAHTAVVSADGVPLACSARLPPDRVQQLAAIASGLLSLSSAAAGTFAGGDVVRTSVEMEGGYLFLMALGQGAVLALLAAPRCELGLLAYEMSVLVDQIGQRLEPAPRTNPDPSS